jgi:hypothetical protein
LLKREKSLVFLINHAYIPCAPFLLAFILPGIFKKAPWYEKGWPVHSTLFLDLLSPHIPNKVQNGNKGPIQTYSIFGQFLVTGFIGAFLNPYFQIPGIRAWNPKSPVLREEGPTLLFPYGWQITVQVGWSRGGKRPVLGVTIFLGSGLALIIPKFELHDSTA